MVALTFFKRLFEAFLKGLGLQSLLRWREATFLVRRDRTRESGKKIPPPL